MASGWTIGTSSGNKLITQPTIGTSTGNKDATQVWLGTSGGNKLIFPTMAFANIINLDTAPDPFTNATVTLSFTNTGTATSVGANVGTIASGNWILPASLAPGDYEIFATQVSGTVSTGTVGSWLALSTTRTWTVNRITSGSKACVLQLDIRSLGTTNVYSAQFNLTATKP